MIFPSTRILMKVHFPTFSHLRLSAKQGKAVGRVLPYEKGNSIKDSYDPRTLVRNAVLSPPTIPSAYCYNRNGTGKMEKSAGETRRDFSSNTKQIPNCSLAAKLAPDIAIDIDSNLYYRGWAGGKKLDHGDGKVIIDTNLLQVKAQYGELGVGTTSNVAAATLQYGVARMY